MSEYLPYLVVMAVLFIFGWAVIKLIDLLAAKGHLKKLRPAIEKLIREAEIRGEHGKKMDYVLGHLLPMIPPKYRVVLKDKRVQAFVEKIFQEIKDHLLDETDNN